MVHLWQMAFTQRIMSFVVWTLLKISLGWNIIRLPVGTGAFTLSSHLQTWSLLPGNQDRFSWKLLSLSHQWCHQGVSQKTSLQRISRGKLKRFMPLSRSYSYTAPVVPTLLSECLVPNLSRDINSLASIRQPAQKALCGKRNVCNV